MKHDYSNAMRSGQPSGYSSGGNTEDQSLLPELLSLSRSVLRTAADFSQQDARLDLIASMLGDLCSRPALSFEQLNSASISKNQADAAREDRLMSAIEAMSRKLNSFDERLATLCKFLEKKKEFI